MYPWLILTETIVDKDLRVEADEGLTEETPDLAKCIVQFVVTVEKNVKFPFSPQVVSRFSATIVSENKEVVATVLREVKEEMTEEDQIEETEGQMLQGVMVKPNSANNSLP